MTAREMWVHAIKGGDEMGEGSFAVTSHDEGVGIVDIYEKMHTPESWADLSAEIARALAIVCGPCIGPDHIVEGNKMVDIEGAQG